MAVFRLGDRVKVKGTPHMPGQRLGRIGKVHGNAYGIFFDGMRKIHLWYVAEELEKTDSGDHAVGPIKFP